jgi:hypothetical protein
VERSLKVGAMIISDFKTVKSGAHGIHDVEAKLVVEGGIHETLLIDAVALMNFPGKLHVSTLDEIHPCQHRTAPIEGQGVNQALPRLVTSLENTTLVDTYLNRYFKYLHST